MNYLAHALLSFDNKDILAGNMISDFVKGKKQFDYPITIQKGIQLHRAIDTFTDSHEITKEIKKIFVPAYRLYAGAFTDVIYDYFLANDKSNFENDAALKAFTQHSYAQLEENKEWFGLKFGAMFPYMKIQDWLYNYQFDWGIQKSLEGVKRRSAYITESQTAFDLFLKNKDHVQPLYAVFFPAVKTFTADTLAQLLNS